MGLMIPWVASYCRGVLCRVLVYLSDVAERLVWMFSVSALQGCGGRERGRVKKIVGRVCSETSVRRGLVSTKYSGGAVSSFVTCVSTQGIGRKVTLLSEL